MLARLSFILLIFMPFELHAQASKHLSDHKDWSAFVHGEGGSKVCFVQSKAGGWKPKGIRRGDPFLQVAHYPAEKVFGEVSFNVGYPLKAKSRPRADVEVRGKRHRFTFYVEDTGDRSSAWVDENKKRTRNGEMVKAMKAGRRLAFTATSARGTVVTDSYSLTGFSAAYKAIDRACRP